MIIDCHTHLSVMEEGDNFESAAKKFLNDLATNGIDGAIIIADNVSNDDCADTDRLIKYFKGVKNIWLIGSTSPFDPIERIKPFEKLIEDRQILAMKLFPGHDKIFLNDPRYLPDIELCNKHKIPLVIHTGINTGDDEAATYNDPKYIAEIAKKFPNLSIVVSHYYWPKLQYCFDMTDGLDNIYFDTSALADDEVIGMSGGWDAIRDILEKTIKRRPGSVLFGTDYPMCPVPAHLKLINELHISDQAKEEILGQAAIRLFGLK